MAYKIVEETTYFVAGSSFKTKMEAQLQQLLSETNDRITGEIGEQDLYYHMQKHPENLIAHLQAYVVARNALTNEHAPRIYGDITEENFNSDKAFDAGKELDAYIYNIHEMRHFARNVANSGRKIDAIKFVRSCFQPTPGLLESKNYVEALMRE